MLYLHSKTAFSSNNLIQRIIDCPFAEQTVQIKAMIAALMVMFMAAVIASVPYFLNSVNIFRLSAVQFLKEMLIHLLTVSVFPRNIDLQCLVNEIFFGIHNVGEISKGLSVVGRAVDVDMDTAGGICYRPARAKIPDELLDRLYIVVYANGRNKLNGTLAAQRVPAPVRAAYTSVANNFPFPILIVPDGIRVVCTSDMIRFRPEILRNNIGGFGSGQSRHLYLYPEFLLFRFITSEKYKKQADLSTCFENIWFSLHFHSEIHVGVLCDLMFKLL